MVDDNGSDAIWIQEGNSAAGYGHSGLLVQDEYGEWWFFFWGPRNDVPTKRIIEGDVPNGMIYEKVNVDGYDLKYTEDVIRALQSSGISSIEARATLITETVFFKGDYSNTHAFLRFLNMVKDDYPYNVLKRNCVQQSVLAMSYSNDMFESLTGYIPNHVMWSVYSMGETNHRINPWNLPGITHSISTTN